MRSTPAARRDGVRARAFRTRPLLVGAAIVAAAAAVVVALAFIGSGGADPRPRSSPVDFSGLAQAGPVLGDPAAPVEIVEYADLQCPFCAQAASAVLPQTIDRWVRPGVARVRFEPLTFLGPDSVRGGLAAAAAARQDILWQFVDGVYAAQGAENSGWLTDALVRDVARRHGADMTRFEGDRVSEGVRAQLQEATARARASGILSTPTFVVRGPRGERRLEGVPAPSDLDRAVEAVR